MISCVHHTAIEDDVWTYTIAAKSAITQTLGSLSVSIALYGRKSPGRK